MQSFVNRIFKVFLLSTLSFVTAMVFALPAPKDIEQAVQAGNYQQAEALLREVLREKPGSAKAHYELGQVLARQSRMPEAHQALIKAKEIDPALKFTDKPEKFRDLLDRTGAPGAGVTVTSGLHSTPLANAPGSQSSADAPRATPSAGDHGSGIGSSIPMSYVWIGLVGVGILGFLLVRMARGSAQPQAPANYGLATAGAMGAPQRGFGGGGGYGGYGPSAPPPSSGPGAMTGAVVGGLAGVAAGYALSKALEGDHHDAASQSLRSSEADHFQPLQSGQPQDFGSFDAGSGDGWDGGGDSSGGGGDDW